MIIGVLLVVFTPAFRYTIGIRETVLYIRIVGIIMVAITSGVLLATRKVEKDRVPSWVCFLLVVLLGSLFLANTVIREVSNAIKGRGIYRDLASQSYQE